MCNKLNRVIKNKTNFKTGEPLTENELKFAQSLSSRLGGKKSKNKPIGKPISGRQSYRRRLLG